jgi:deoxyribonuclease-4
MAMTPLMLGAHMSMAGGFFRAIERGRDVGCQCVQMFLKNNNQWHAPDIADRDAERLADAIADCGMRHVIAHSSYLINLASPDKALWRKSLDAFVTELQRAERLGIPYVVLHPGAHTTGSERAGLRQVVRALNEVHRQTRGLRAMCLLENTAGQGTCLGWRLEQLAAILDAVRCPERLGVCFDTCHAFAAGYGLAAQSEYRQTMRALQQLVGFERIKAIHLNDSKRERGSRVDRHEHIGRGQIGAEGFRRVLADRRLRGIPMYLETPKGLEPRSKLEWDVVNLRRLRALAQNGS